MIDFLLACVREYWQVFFQARLVGPGRLCQRWARILLVVLAILALSIGLFPELAASRLFVIAVLIIVSIFVILMILTAAYAAEKELLRSSISAVESNESVLPLSGSRADQHISRHNNE